MSKKCMWIYGWAMSTQIWSEVIESLPDFEHYLVNFSECNEINDFYKVIENKLKASPGEWTLIGWSLGGMLALETIFNQKKREQFGIDSIVIISSTLKFVSQDRSEGWPQRIVQRMKTQLLAQPEETIKQFKKFVFQSTDHTKLRGVFTQAAETDFNLNGLEAGLNYLMKTDLTSSWNHFSEEENTIPILWIHGENDEVCPLPSSPSSITNGEKIIVGEGHAPFLFDREKFINLTKQFLN
ncbi:alpha/beta fold hydrolase [Chengkuizengella sp. SCS-71B]|uniref:alpha/beta fold hydrolase n=1 Tax=Chengkuizengella sp. SCS-71B TaxID=3115290 RepID=UPI0032C2128F